MRYLVTGKNTGVQIVFEYASNNVLKSFDIREGEVSYQQLEWLRKHLPIKPEILDFWKKMRADALKVEELPEDLSFERFWDDYDYKVGNKKRAEKLWNQLSDAEKLKVLQSLKRYKYYLATHPGIEKAHATTFLNQRRWENEFK